MGGWPPTKLPSIPGVSVHRTHVLFSSRLRMPSVGGVGPSRFTWGRRSSPARRPSLSVSGCSYHPAERPLRGPRSAEFVHLAGTCRWFRPELWRRLCPHPRSDPVLLTTRPPSRPSSPVSAAAPPPSPPAPSSCGRLPPDRPGSTGATRLRARSSRRGRRESPGRVGQAARATEAMAASSGARELTGSPSCRLR